MTRFIKLFIQRLLVPFHWLFVRLPKPFTLTFLVVALFYFALLFPLVDSFLGHSLVVSLNYSLAALGTAKIVSGILGLLLVPFALIVKALLTILAALFGILVSHFVAGKFYKIYRLLRVKPGLPPAPVPPKSKPCVAGQNNPLAAYKRIGIILSGGGAKGAYQAGAMKAIYEFLEEYDAHKNLKMIAATSIGSWNALFWLADLVKSSNGEPGPLEQWWSEVDVQKIILPIRYVPTRQNYLLSNQPWRENFDAVFNGTKAGDRLLRHAEEPFSDGAIRFYFTHSNIGKAHLAFTTNRNDWTDVTANQPIERSRPVVAPNTFRVVSDGADASQTLENIRTGVFSSMDIPPLFPYTAIDKDFFEDGGVIDNLPIRFGTEIEECDLLFILPLNASFERTVDQHSLMRRLARVTEIRQGVLERNSFKMIYLYNELASLRERINYLEGHQSPEQAESETAQLNKTVGKIADRALKRTHRVVRIFSICPAPELKIGTTEFWKTKEAGEAFQFMYEATKNELKRFPNVTNSNQIRMALVAPVGDYAPADGDSSSAVTDGSSEDAGAVNSPVDGDVPILKQTENFSYRVTYFKDF